MRTVLVCVLVLCSVVTGIPQRKRRFDGNHVFRLIPKTKDEVNKILNVAKLYKADIWKLPVFANDTLDLHIGAENVRKFVSELKTTETEFSTLISDLQKLVDEENSHTTHVKARATTSFSLSHYHSSQQISGFLDSVASASSITTVHTAGYSVERKPIKYVKISTGGNKKAILIDGGIHAREWIATAVTLYLIDQLAMNPQNNPEITRLVQKFDWYLLPLVNPDGYDYSRTNDRMWRKNRSSSHSIFGTCTGTDLNRNFGFHWNPAVGGSTDECEEIYAGTAAFSAPEAAALGQLMRSLSGTAVAYLNLHSYGQMWLYPWGYSVSVLPSDVADLRRLANVGASAIFNAYHAHYTTGGDAADLYPAAGGADDYAKGAAGIKYSYTVELRDTGRHGFILPASYIVPSGVETLQGILAFASELAVHENL